MRQQWRRMGDSGSNSAEQLMSGCIIRPVEGSFECQLICGAMAFENQTTKTQQSRTVVTTVINPVFKGI
jgi:hypothetical protein